MSSPRYLASVKDLIANALLTDPGADSEAAVTWPEARKGVGVQTGCTHT